MDSILDTVKSGLGVELDYSGFDSDILLGINSAITTLNQVGVGPSDGFLVTSSDEVWSQIVGTDKKLESVKSYILLKTRLLFDPPTTSFLLDAITRQITELEWRLMVQVDPIPTPPVDPEGEPA